MPNNLIDRLKAEANAIDERDGDYELRCLLLEAAGAIGDALHMHQQIVNRLPDDMLNSRCDTWSGTLSSVSQLANERNNALAEVDRLKAQNANIIKAAEYVLGRREVTNNATGCEMRSTMPLLMEMLASAIDEIPARSLAEIEARAVEVILKDLRSDMPPTNTAIRFFERLQLRVDVLRQKARRGSDRGGSGYDREVLGLSNEGDTVTV